MKTANLHIRSTQDTVSSFISVKLDTWITWLMDLDTIRQRSDSFHSRFFILGSLEFKDPLCRIRLNLTVKLLSLSRRADSDSETWERPSMEGLHNYFKNVNQDFSPTELRSRSSHMILIFSMKKLIAHSHTHIHTHKSAVYTGLSTGITCNKMLVLNFYVSCLAAGIFRCGSSSFIANLYWILWWRWRWL